MFKIEAHIVLKTKRCIFDGNS